ncbi:TetR/AcrR family transcriptional regulator [Chromobacterium violaceum]|uniref:TetR/AcrR family transcriptional regulator n=1 Tax=Chromobacterium violaceum TaxID=536 RepID=UPI001B323770|nr:TetR/AcrR family transcriptional regulator [Chromobacterium violaceum]MBP4044936.1 TetR/AcrR family transcriptional regulator [Chromobacterium violaceum]
MSSASDLSPIPLSRPRGRPAVPEQDLRRQVLQAATELLLEDGYRALSIEAVAKRAGVAKKTVYRFADNRERLLAAIVDDWTAGLAGAVAMPQDEGQDLPQALEALLLALAERVLSAEAVGMFKLLINDFPGREQALATYAGHGVRRSASLLADWLDERRRRGLLRMDDPATCAELLLAMAIAEPLRQMALGLAAPGVDAALRARVRAAARLCYEGMRPAS